MGAKLMSKFANHFTKINNLFHQLGDISALPSQLWKRVFMLHTIHKESVRPLSYQITHRSKDDVTLQMAHRLVYDKEDDLQGQVGGYLELHYYHSYCIHRRFLVVCQASK